MSSFLLSCLQSMVLQFHYFERFTVATINWLTVIEYLWHYLVRICTICRNHNLVLFTFMTFLGCVSGATLRLPNVPKTAYLSGALSLTPVFGGVVCSSIVCLLCSGLYINVCPFFPLLAIVLSVLLRVTIYFTFLVFSNFC